MLVHVLVTWKEKKNLWIFKVANKEINVIWWAQNFASFGQIQEIREILNR